MDVFMEKNDTKYLHAAARVHSLENKLISRNELMKVIEVGEAEDAFKFLSGKEMFRNRNVKDYEKAFEVDLGETYKLIENITDNSEITYIFRYPMDGHNLKVYVKSQMTEKSFEELYKETGTFTIDKMREELNSRRFEKVPQKLGEAALTAMDRLAKTRDSQAVDIIIDKAVLLVMREKAEKIGNPLLCRYVASRTDVVNIETAVRLMRMKKDAYQVRKMFAEGGSIDVSDIEESYSTGYEGIGKLIDKANMSRRMSVSVAALKRGEPLTVFEQNIDGCFKDLFAGAKIVPFGLEPVITFLYLKEREIKAVRLVLVSKIFGIPKEQIAERLRYIYAD
ncbi:MAG: V-type ATPase subunit [Clostridiales bacterium]|nr:V-type ATPase subunit [Clostridiales bacterium]